MCSKYCLNNLLGITYLEQRCPTRNSATLLDIASIPPPTGNKNHTWVDSMVLIGEISSIRCLHFRTNRKILLCEVTSGPVLSREVARIPANIDSRAAIALGCQPYSIDTKLFFLEVCGGSWLQLCLLSLLVNVGNYIIFYPNI